MKEKITGLSEKQVLNRIEKGQVNKLDDDKTRSNWEIIRDNVFTLFNLFNVLIAIALLYVGAYTNLFYMAIIILNCAIGIYQEIHARNLVKKLSVLKESKVKVLRDGKEQEILVDEIVLDDVFLFDFLNYRNNKVHRQLEKYFVKAQMALQIKRKWPFPNYYNGLGWFSFTRGAVEEIVEYIQLHRKVVDFTFAPDEVIFQSIILNSDKNYKVINNNLRFTLWSNDEEVGSSDILTEQHYQSLINSDAFFARKIEPARSEKLIKMINNYIQTT